MSDRRLLILLNPGRQSRHYLLGIAAAARRMGVPHACVEMERLWQARDAEGADTAGRRRGCARVQAEIARMVHRLRITHAIGYAWNGVLDFGLLAAEQDRTSEPPLAALGVRHVLLWTDHPNWLCESDPIKSRNAALLAHPMHTHIVKSESAAAEVSAVLGWPNVHSLAMAEEYGSLRSRPGDQSTHDVVAVMGYASRLPDPLHQFLPLDAPDPAQIDAAMVPIALAAWRRAVAIGENASGPSGHDALERLAAAWLELKVRSPLDSFWRLKQRLAPEHHSSLGWLGADAQRWYAATDALRRMSDWRRSFYIAWLARRMNVGVYGVSTHALGFDQPRGADRWVEYDQQSEIYARGRVAININGGPDEEGCTHKPFQMAAAGVPCVHHRTRGLAELFQPGHEIAEFDRPDELLRTVRSLVGDDRRRADMADAMHERARCDHTWDDRLGRMLDLADADSAVARAALAPALAA